MKHIKISLKMLALMTLLTGVLYPLAMTVLAQTFFKEKANGSLLIRGNQVLGSNLIAQKFESPRYFWPRPSAVDYNPLPSGGSNLGPISADLNLKVQERKRKLGEEPIPPDLLFASGSGLDPHVSLEAALYQIQRVAQNRGMDPVQLRSIVIMFIEDRQWKILGEPRVNVLSLNLFLDEPPR